MFGNHHCIRCDKSLPYKGICGDCAPVREEKGMNLPRCYHCGSGLVNAYCESCGENYSQHIIVPAPKEEGMDLVKTNCKTCGIPLLNSEVCYKCSDRAAERRTLYREAYMAALSGACLNPCTTNNMDVENAHKIAIETVRQWDAMMAELEEI